MFFIKLLSRYLFFNMIQKITHHTNGKQITVIYIPKYLDFFSRKILLLLLLFNGKCFSLTYSYVAAMPIKYSLFRGLDGGSSNSQYNSQFSPSFAITFLIFLILLNGVTQLNDIFFIIIIILVATAAAAASGLSIIHS